MKRSFTILAQAAFLACIIYYAIDRFEHPDREFPPGEGWYDPTDVP
jgi:hypothetical protein